MVDAQSPLDGLSVVVTVDVQRCALGKSETEDMPLWVTVSTWGSCAVSVPSVRMMSQ